MLFKDLKAGLLFRKLSWETGYFEVKMKPVVKSGIIFNCASVDRAGFFGHVDPLEEIQEGKVVIDE